jgi:hypothetical protein
MESFRGTAAKAARRQLCHPEIPEDDNFAEILETIRAERLAWQPRNPFEGVDFDDDHASGSPTPTPAPAPAPGKGKGKG